MTPQEALNLLNQAASKVQTDRDTHVKIQEAVNILQAVVNPSKSDSKTDDLGDDE